MMGKTYQVTLRFNVEVRDPDSLRTFAETIQRVKSSQDFTVEQALNQRVLRLLHGDRIQKMLDTIPGMLVVGHNVGCQTGEAWPEAEGTDSGQ